MWNSPVTSYPPGRVEVRERETQGGAGFVAVAAVGKWESRSDFQAEWKSRSLTSTERLLITGLPDK